MVWLIDQEYDRDHRAFHMTERRTDLQPLKIRYHGTVDMAYDERYTEFIQPTGLLPFITLVSRGGTKEGAPAGAPFAWIRTNFGLPPPEGANEDTIKTYTRVYLWYMISRTLFADSGGKLAHWCWLKALTVLERRWSWGTATLAYLYRQLDEACRRTGSGGIGGCLLLLSVWSWDRLSVGRPRVLTERSWPHYRNNPDREPTWAFLWDNVSEMTSDPKMMYKHYTEELDTLTAEQVDWEPYGTYYHIGAGMADLNPMCLEEARFWRLIGSGRGRSQIGLTIIEATSQRSNTVWKRTRIELVKPAYEDDILYDPIEFDEVAQSQHDTFAHRGRSTSIASELNFVRSEIQKTAQECEIVWDQSHTDDKPIGPMRHFIKNTARKMRRLANLLGCRDTEIAATSSSEEAEIPDDDTILSQGIASQRKKQATRSAYQLKPRGKAPARYTPDDYVNRGKKEEQQQQPGQRTKRLAVRKQPARRGLRGG
nr:uncharacterized protein LOC127330136 [Lolium perenne]